MNKTSFDVDPLNLLAIEWLEQMGNDAPTERQIKAMESLLKQKINCEIERRLRWLYC